MSHKLELPALFRRLRSVDKVVNGLSFEDREVPLTSLAFGDMFISTDLGLKVPTANELCLVINPEYYFYVVFKREVDDGEPLHYRKRIYFLSLVTFRVFGRLVPDAKKLRVLKVVQA